MVKTTTARMANAMDAWWAPVLASLLGVPVLVALLALAVYLHGAEPLREEIGAVPSLEMVVPAGVAPPVEEECPEYYAPPVATRTPDFS